MKPDWMIRDSKADWQCDWEGSARFQLRYFKSLPFVEKIKAVENMCRTHAYFQQRASQRRALQAGRSR
jgi:hypothetical protein